MNVGMIGDHELEEQVETRLDALLAPLVYRMALELEQLGRWRRQRQVFESLDRKLLFILRFNAIVSS